MENYTQNFLNSLNCVRGKLPAKFKNHVYNKNDFKTPFENAIDELVSLEKETLDSQNDFKLFYSKLTQIAKEYLENDIKISASESTTTQLIDKIIYLRQRTGK